VGEFSLVHRVQPARVGVAPHPGLLLLHGLGSNEDDLMGLAPQVDSRLTVVSARAPLTHGYGGFSWYEFERDGPGLGSTSIEAAFDLLRAFLDEMIEAYTLDPSRMYVGGFSQGAAMAGALALLEPSRLAGGIMISGYLPPEGNRPYPTERPTGRPFFQAHGTVDTVVPLEYAHLSRDLLTRLGVNLTYGEYPVGHSVSMPEMLDLSRWLGGVLDAGEREPDSAGEVLR